MKIKICGLTRACDIDYINEAEPEYVGFVFAESRRQITEEQGAFLRERIRPGITVAGVFADASEEEILRIANRGIVDIIQLHGNETPDFTKLIKTKSGCRIIKAVHMGTEEYPEVFYKDYQESGVDFFLFDTATGGRTASGRTAGGGTGKRFDWKQIPRLTLPYFLAGGINRNNIEEAVLTQVPYGVDISSGVETEGVKDRDKIIEIIRRIRNV